MDLCIIFGEKRLLLPRHTQVDAFETFLPDTHRVFEMPWYSRSAGRYYHDRLLDHAGDRRVETSALAMRADYKAGDVPVLIFSGVLEDSSDLASLCALLEKLAAELSDTTINISSRVLSTRGLDEAMRAQSVARLDKALGALDSLQIAPSEILFLEDLPHSAIHNAQLNLICDQIADGCLARLADLGFILGRARAIDILSKRLDVLEQAGLTINPDIPDAYLDRFTESLLGELLHRRPRGKA
ncbi:hypothetical protein [Celeribacter baekdonensis]|uniref:hypothetical protein n=1 Tax=Celeribacter baekdonensis TaxID=875171 RepID=UPI0030DBC58E|tara:strand:+ start:271921 stop:272646 length:726 start_codon:yes stop_codon:yes gene_type:complete